MNSMAAQDAIMTAQAQVEQWRAGFMADWQSGEHRQQLKMYYSMLTGEAKDQLRQQDPEGFSKLESFMAKK